ncbi:putative membrane protein [Anaerosolibacter carboniphilus]|uniref:Putative membrane protein n=1 Tax=Anaerosolibacter carboniphilus TaxID=1417629 RepID=A0A841KU44_9FIRM|nr:hypothetical protein [Anaerosolibacter carboniphilus]MBB6217116.1 putative membrane protein [Anaerosolibacter carboniphilus]
MNQIKKFELLFPLILLILFLITTSMVSAHYENDHEKDEAIKDLTQGNLDFWGIPIEIHDKVLTTDHDVQQEQYFFWGISPHLLKK